MALRVQTSIIDTQPLPDAVVYPGWWQVPCKFIPDCQFGFFKPWLVIPPPLSPTPVWGATPDVTSDVTPSIDPAVMPLLQATVTSPARLLVPAAEHDNVLAARGGSLAPRAALVDVGSRTFLGAIAQNADGRLLPVRGRMDALGAVAMHYCTEPAQVDCSLAKANAGSTPLTVATLSGVRGRLFLLSGPVAPEGARLLAFDLLSEEWSEIPLTGDSLPNVPLALTYDAQADCLFVLTRAKQAGAVLRLLRIRLDGRTDEIGQGLGFAHGDATFLTAAETGDLVLAVSRAQGQPHFRIARIRPFGSAAKVVGVYKDKGTLVASPFLTERALNFVVSGPQGLKFSEVAPNALEPPTAVGLESIWK